jgi:hypothetical protein
MTVQQNEVQRFKNCITNSRFMKSSLLIFFLLITIKVAAPDLNVIYIVKAEPVDVYDKLIKAVIQVECAGNGRAFNYIEQATGPLQIRPIRLLDYNRRTGKNYKLEDCYNLQVSKEIFLYYATRRGYPHFEKIARSWNGSGKKTLDYWKKVKVYLERG